MAGAPVTPKNSWALSNSSAMVSWRKRSFSRVQGPRSQACCRKFLRVSSMSRILSWKPIAAWRSPRKRAPLQKEPSLRGTKVRPLPGKVASITSLGTTDQ